MAIDLNGRLNHANGLLKAGKIGVRIQARGDRLYLVATLPPKPESLKPYPHQQRISLGYRFNQIGLDKAVKDARVLSARLIEGTFSWGDYVEQRPMATFGDVIDLFSERYESERLQKGHDPILIDQTLKTNYLKHLKDLDRDKDFSVAVLESRLKSIEHTATRRGKAIAYAALADAVGVEHNLRSLAGGYSYKSINPREVPTDDLIAETYLTITSKRWRTVYALLAIYGLRNHEAFRCDFLDLPVLFVNRGKTGERYIYPLYPEWANDWLTDLTMPKVNLNRTNLQLGRDVTTWFYRVKTIPFAAYNLRHAWARRSIDFGWDITLAAKQMGHSVKVHSEVYHAWITQDTYDKAYQQLLANPNRPKPPQ
jgi:hypothetical protein